jgi:hypothetical protein
MNLKENIRFVFELCENCNIQVIIRIAVNINLMYNFLHFVLFFLENDHFVERDYFLDFVRIYDANTT